MFDQKEPSATTTFDTSRIANHPVEVDTQKSIFVQALTNKDGFRNFMRSPMHRIPLGFTAALLVLHVASTGSSCYRSGARSGELRNAQLTPAIEMRADEAGLDDLRTKTLAGDDIEIRIWSEPAAMTNAAQGYILERHSNSWTCDHLLSTESGISVAGDGQQVVIGLKPVNKSSTIEVEPLNGWEFLWNNLTSAGLLTLPDESQLDLKSDRSTPPGNIYVIEVKSETGYRVYRYTNPEHFTLPETRAMSRIIQLLHDEFSNDQQQ
jgi:hypothetical protein